MSSKIIKVLEAIETSGSPIERKDYSIGSFLEDGNYFEVSIVPTFVEELVGDMEDRLIGADIKVLINGADIKVLINGAKVYGYGAGMLKSYNEYKIVEKYLKVRNTAFTSKMVDDQKKIKNSKEIFNGFLVK